MREVPPLQTRPMPEDGDLRDHDLRLPASAFGLEDAGENLAVTEELGWKLSGIENFWAVCSAAGDAQRARSPLLLMGRLTIGRPWSRLP